MPVRGRFFARYTDQGGVAKYRCGIVGLEIPSVREIKGCHGRTTIERTVVETGITSRKSDTCQGSTSFESRDADFRCRSWNNDTLQRGLICEKTCRHDFIVGNIFICTDLQNKPSIIPFGGYISMEFRIRRPGQRLIIRCLVSDFIAREIEGQTIIGAKHILVLLPLEFFAIRRTSAFRNTIIIIVCNRKTMVKRPGKEIEEIHFVRIKMDPVFRCYRDDIGRSALNNLRDIRFMVFVKGDSDRTSQWFGIRAGRLELDFGDIRGCDRKADTGSNQIKKQVQTFRLCDIEIGCRIPGTGRGTLLRRHCHRYAGAVTAVVLGKRICRPEFILCQGITSLRYSGKGSE